MDFFTRNRNNPIARAELYQLSYIPPFQAEWQAASTKKNILFLFFGLCFSAQRKGKSSVRDKRLGEAGYFGKRVVRYGPHFFVLDPFRLCE